MRFPQILTVAALLLLSSSALRADQGEDLAIQTVSGRMYRHCQVLRVYPDGVTFRHSEGMAKLLFTDMTPEWRQHFGYDAAKVEAYERKKSEDRAKAREVSAARAAEAAKAMAAAYGVALAEAQAAEARGEQPAYYGGGYGWLDTGLDNANGWYGNGCRNGFPFANGGFSSRGGAFSAPKGRIVGYGPANFEGFRQPIYRQAPYAVSRMVQAAPVRCSSAHMGK